MGRLSFREDGDAIDCSKMGVGGKAVPPNVDKVTDLKSDALFILLVEKDAAFMRLAEDRFYNSYPCGVQGWRGCAGAGFEGRMRVNTAPTPPPSSLFHR